MRATLQEVSQEQCWACTHVTSLPGAGYRESCVACTRTCTQATRTSRPQMIVPAPCIRAHVFDIRSPGMPAQRNAIRHVVELTTRGITEHGTPEVSASALAAKNEVGPFAKLSRRHVHPVTAIMIAIAPSGFARVGVVRLVDVAIVERRVAVLLVGALVRLTVVRHGGGLRLGTPWRHKKSDCFPVCR